MILADIQTTFGVMLLVFCLVWWLMITVACQVLGGLGKSFHDSYQKGGGNRQLGKNALIKGLGMVLKLLIFKR